jgi:glycosyltransferase involved in cell wall biosynthesis
MTHRRPRHLLHVFPSFAVGGSQLRFAQLARLHDRRYRHTVIAIDGDLTMAARLPRDVEIDCLPGTFKTKSSLAGATAAWRTLKRIAPDVLVTYNWGAMDWSIAKRFLPRLRHIHIEDGFGPEEKVHQLRRRVQWRHLVLNEPRTKVAVPSKNLEKIALETWRLRRERVCYIPNGIDCARFAAQPSAQNSNEIVIGTVASLRPEKNLARLIDLFCQAQTSAPARRMKLVIVGDGAEREALQQAAARSAYASHIGFTGTTSAPEHFLAAMHIFALTSDTEQMPLSVLEAMAAGLPVLSFNVGDLPFMVARENVAMVSISLVDGGAYIKNLLNLAVDADLRARIGAANRKVAETRFDEQTMATAYAELFG